MALGIERVQRLHTEPGCKHYKVTFVDDDTNERRSIVVHLRQLRQESTEVMNDEVLKELLKFFVVQKDVAIESLAAKNLIGDVAGGRGVVRSLLRDIIS